MTQSCFCYVYSRLVPAESFHSGLSEGVQQGVNIYPLCIIPFYTNVFSCVPFLSVVKLIVKANYTYQLKVLL